MARKKRTSKKTPTEFVRGTETVWTDSATVPAAVEFFQALLTRYDTDLLERVQVRTLPSNPWNFRCQRPVRTGKGARTFESGYQLRVGVHVKGRFPRKLDIPVDWNNEDPQSPYTVTRTATFASRDEVAAFALGCAVFRFLRHSKQVPGLDINSRARRHGLYALAAFRSGHPFDPYVDTDRLVARDALEEAGDPEGVAMLEPY